MEESENKFREKYQKFNSDRSREKNDNLPSGTADEVMRKLIQAAPVPWPIRLMFSGSPPNSPIFSLIQWRAAIWSRSPKLAGVRDRKSLLGLRKPEGENDHEGGAHWRGRGRLVQIGWKINYQTLLTYFLHYYYLLYFIQIFMSPCIILFTMVYLLYYWWYSQPVFCNMSKIKWHWIIIIKQIKAFNSAR